LYKIAVGTMPDTAKIRSRRVRCSADICPITKLLDMSWFNFGFSPCIITVNHFYWPTKCTWLYKT